LAQLLSGSRPTRCRRDATRPIRAMCRAAADDRRRCGLDERDAARRWPLPLLASRDLVTVAWPTRAGRALGGGGGEPQPHTLRPCCEQMIAATRGGPDAGPGGAEGRRVHPTTPLPRLPPDGIETEQGTVARQPKERRRGPATWLRTARRHGAGRHRAALSNATGLRYERPRTPGPAPSPRAGAEQSAGCVRRAALQRVMAQKVGSTTPSNRSRAARLRQRFGCAWGLVAVQMVEARRRYAAPALGTGQYHRLSVTPD
jgi:hypothetical protein